MNPDCEYCGFKDGRSIEHSCEPKGMKEVIESLGILLSDVNIRLAFMEDGLKDFVKRHGLDARCFSKDDWIDGCSCSCHAAKSPTSP